MVFQEQGRMRGSTQVFSSERRSMESIGLKSMEMIKLGPLSTNARAACRAFVSPTNWNRPTFTLRKGISAALDSLLPPACLLCGEAHVDEKLCRTCEFALLHTWPPKAISCQFCGLPRPAEPAFLLDVRCPLCKTAGNIQGIDRVVALAIYLGPVREAVVASKLVRHASLATALGKLLGDHVKTQLCDQVPDRVTFVPTHLFRRIQRRGLSGAAAMAVKAAEQLGQPCSSLLKLTRHVGKQSLLPDADRPNNVKGAFALRNSVAWPGTSNVRDQHVLLVDDVLTTGSTASEIARVLKTAGASRVTLAVVARAVRH
jgi:competence protein ComFC